MKRTFITAFSLTLTSASLMAQPPGGGGRGGDSGELVGRMLSFDENKDGKLSKEELPERLQGMFSRADKDEDGYLSKEEITADLGNRTGGRGADGRPGGGRGGEGGREEMGRGRGGEGGPGGPGGRRGGREGFGGGPEGMGGPPAFNPVIAAIDTNNDGELSADEIKNAAVALAKLDKNNDGKLDESELRPEPGSGGRGGFGGGSPVAGMMERLDADKNGKLTGDEIPERMRERLADIDKNDDKAVDKSELEAIFQRMGGGPGGPRGGQGGPGGRGGQGGGQGRQRPPIED